MKLVVLLIVGVILYLIARNYKTEKFQNINLEHKENFQGDLLNHEAGLLVALMAKVAKADGQVCNLEAELLKHTFTDISSHFENAQEIREKLKDLYNQEKNSFENTLVICQRLYSLTKFDYSKRVKILEYLLNLAFIDKNFSDAEKMICEDISNALKIKRVDFENMISNFEAFYAQVQDENRLDLQKAYDILGANDSDDEASLKKKYRTLVKKHHPDIIAGKGGSQSIIDEATKKLQDINEAYELIKSSKGF